MVTKFFWPSSIVKIGFGPNVNDVTPCDCPSKRQKRQVREGGKAKTEEYK